MEGIATIILILVGLFLLYRTGLMDLTQKSMERGANIADRHLEYLDYSSREKQSRNLGKLEKKMKSEEPRSSTKRLDSLFKELEQLNK